MKVEIYAELSLEDALKMVKSEADKHDCVCWAEFNGKKINSTDSIDDAYLKVCGCTKAEYEDKVRKEREKWKRQEQEYKANIPNLLDKYLKDARGLVIEEELDNWDKCILPLLSGIHRGIELGCTLDIIRIMRDESISLDERLGKAQQEFYSQGYSGESASLMLAMLCKFCPDGDKLVNALKRLKEE